MNDIPRLLLLTHGHLGLELIRSAEMIVGDIPNITAISLMPGMTPEEYEARVKEASGSDPTNVILLVDLFGGTPSNCAAYLSSRWKTVTVSGLNLPILIQAVQSRESLRGANLARVLVDAGRDGIKDVIAELGGL